MIPVNTAREMAEAVLSECTDADILIMAAAVADYKPVKTAKSKIKKEQGGLDMIELERTVDILKEVAALKEKEKSGPVVVIGFAAETENLLENAKSKLDKKES